jgi:hypothetical protein
LSPSILRPSQQLRQLGDVGGDAAGFVTGMRKAMTPAAKAAETFRLWRRLLRVASTPYEPIDAITDRDERKPSASERSGNAMNATAIPLSWAAAFMDLIRNISSADCGR